jgi:hypothetical protein
MAQRNFTIRRLSLSAGKGTMNAPRCWQPRNDVHCVYTAKWSTPIVSYPYGAMNFMPALGIRILIAHSCTRCRWILKRLSQDGEQVDFSKNLRASLFKKRLSNELNFSRIQRDSTFNSLEYNCLYIRVKSRGVIQRLQVSIFNFTTSFMVPR